MGTQGSADGLTSVQTVKSVMTGQSQCPHAHLLSARFWLTPKPRHRTPCSAAWASTSVARTVKAGQAMPTGKEGAVGRGAVQLGILDCTRTS